MDVTPQVALESTVFVHGLPEPDNVEIALELKRIVRSRGALPRTIGIVDGEIVTDLSDESIRRLASALDVRKVSQRDIPVVVAQRRLGATTVAATAWLAHRAGIPLMATGGLGGVHRGDPFDVSNDLHVLGQTPIVVVCSGAKAILDLRATREHLETVGVTVVGFGTDEFPAFYSAESGLSVDVRCDSADEVAALVRAARSIGHPGAILVTVPVPANDEISWSEIEPLVAEAEQEARRANITASKLTPFLLDRLAHATRGRSLIANRALLKNNASVAADIAVSLSNRV